jgi:hypothetical protein
MSTKVNTNRQRARSWISALVAVIIIAAVMGAVAPLARADSNPFGRGWCTWGAWQLYHNNWGVGPVDAGDAKDWPAFAARKGMPTGTSVKVNSVVVFQPRVCGADPTYGHVAYVTAVSSTASFHIREMNAAGFGVWSERDITMQSGISFIYGPATLPAEPRNPGCTSGTSTSLNMTWTDASNNEVDFVVQYRVGSGGWVFGGKVADNNRTSGTVSGLAASTTYTLQVGARNAAGTHWSAYFYGVTKPAPVAARPTVVIDDPAAAFYGPPYWNIGYVGYGGSVHWTKNAVSAVENYAIWRPSLAGGNYEVQVFIPSNYANTRNAVYQIYTGYGWASRSVNQEPYSNVWISLGTYNFTAGTAAYVQLNDATGEAYLSRMIGFDAVQFIPR